MLTPNEIITKSNTLLAEQGALSKNPINAGCFYFDPNTHHQCGVGILLSPSDAAYCEAYLNLGYISTLSTNTFKNVREIKAIFAAQGINLNDEDTMETLEAIQKNHDQATSFENWKPLP